MNPIVSSGGSQNNEFISFSTVSGSCSISHGVVKLLSALLFIPNWFTLHAQFNENALKKVILEIEGENVFDVDRITEDPIGYSWMATNLGVIGYIGIKGKK